MRPNRFHSKLGRKNPKYFFFLFFLAVTAGLTACTETNKDGQSLVLLEVRLNAPSTAPTDLTVAIENGNQRITEETWAWDGAATNVQKVGIYVDGAVSGSTNVLVQATASGVVVGTAEKSVVITPGAATATLSIALISQESTGQGGQAGQPVSGGNSHLGGQAGVTVDTGGTPGAGEPTGGVPLAGADGQAGIPMSGQTAGTGGTPMLTGAGGIPLAGSGGQPGMNNLGGADGQAGAPPLGGVNGATVMNKPAPSFSTCETKTFWDACGEPNSPTDWPLSGLDVAPDGKRVAIGAGDGRIEIWNVQNGTLSPSGKPYHYHWTLI